MAIDTAEKRRSSAAVSRRMRVPTVTPNALKDQEWRQQAARIYSGILAGENVLAGLTTPFVRRKGRRLRAKA